MSKRLQAMVGLEKVSVNLDAGRVRVAGKTDLHALIRAAQEIGYETQVGDPV